MNEPIRRGPSTVERIALKPLTASVLLALVVASCANVDPAPTATADDELPAVGELSQNPTEINTLGQASEVAERNPAGLAPSSCDDIAALFVAGTSVNADLADPESSAVCADESVIISSNGIPDYTYIVTSPGAPNANDYTFTIPATPTMSASTTDVPALGTAAVTLTGIPIYGPTEGTGGDVLSLGNLSDCGSHNGPTGFHLHLLGTSTTTDCLFTPGEVAAAPQLLGYAFDGYPIYSGNDQYTSSWELTDASLFATDTWSAHSYVAGSGDLDECNGLTDASGNYAYYTTDTFPYVVGCYSGEVDLDAAGAGGGGGEAGGPGGGGGGGGGQGPPQGNG
ncbi:MAG: YHYH protein [Ilumatobacter sp.]